MNTDARPLVTLHARHTCKVRIQEASRQLGIHFGMYTPVHDIVPAGERYALKHGLYSLCHVVKARYIDVGSIRHVL